MCSNLWQQVLNQLGAELDPEEFRRWFSTTSCASDSGSQVTVWVDSERARRHIQTHYLPMLDRALASLGRPHTDVRLVAAGVDDDEDDV
jgi:chromosomal replication initiation ATPase DnaA